MIDGMMYKLSANFDMALLPVWGISWREYNLLQQRGKKRECMYAEISSLVCATVPPNVGQEPELGHQDSWCSIFFLTCLLQKHNFLSREWSEFFTF